MAEVNDPRVAVYVDFDNIVISRYDQVHGSGRFQRDKGTDGFSERLNDARVDVGAVIDYASSFGTLVLTRAYADWSAPVNADYQRQLVGRAVDLVQLFPAAAYGKNGADIRLAVDAVEDMFRLPDLTHVIVVAGDSDYIALAQRCKRLGRYVVGVGVAGSTSKALAAACDEMVSYDALPGVTPAPKPAKKAAKKSTKKQSSGKDGDVKKDDADDGDDATETAARVLERALRLGHEKDDADWLHLSAVKSQIKRMDPSFSERALGHKSFSDFIKANDTIAELDESSTARLVRLR